MAKIIVAYTEIREQYIAREKIDKFTSDQAPFFLKGKGLQGINPKNLQYLWPEAQEMSYREMRDQNSTLQRLAGASARVLEVHGEGVVTSTYFTGQEM